MSARRSLDELLALRDRLRSRRFHTPLEQVQAEVGDEVYREIQASCWDRPVVIRGGEVVGLPHGTYLILLTQAIRRRRDAPTLATVCTR